MSASFSILIGGIPASDLEASFSSLEVDESLDQPGTFSISLPINRTPAGDYDLINDSRLAPLSNIAVVATASDNQPQCIFDGYVLSQAAHLDTGTVASTLSVSATDATWLMNLKPNPHNWTDVTDGQVANTIFQDYDGFVSDPANLTDDSPVHTSDGRSLMQRGPDGDFLRNLARRNGKLFRVFCTSTPGVRTSSFSSPALDGEPVVTLTLNNSTSATVAALEISWDVIRPSANTAKQTLVSDKDADGAGGTQTDSGLPLLGERGLADFLGSTVTALLTPTVNDAQELTQRSQSVLIEAGWFVRCTGTVDVNRLGSILRAGTIAQVNAAGSLHSGRYYIWSVHHHITSEKHSMDFVMMRNAVGAPPSPGPLSGGTGL